jgi:hypothetical protein
MDSDDREYMQLMLDGFNLTQINVSFDLRKEKALDRFERLAESVEQLSDLYENYFK